MRLEEYLILAYLAYKIKSRNRIASTKRSRNRKW